MIRLGLGLEHSCIHCTTLPLALTVISTSFDELRLGLLGASALHWSLSLTQR